MNHDIITVQSIIDTEGMGMNLSSNILLSENNEPGEIIIDKAIKKVKIPKIKQKRNTNAKTHPIGVLPNEY